MRALNIPLPKNGCRLIAFPVLLLSLVAAGPAQASLVHRTSVAIDSTALVAGSAVDDTDTIFA
ncbi:MAG TPA: hypothetical protein VMQ83_10850 [Gammaproteobacteria bacterium]|nr:hypothetical protein [Gammaproteobacteria bacterium]